MLSAVIPSKLSYPAVPLARQQVHQRSVHPGPLVLGANPLNSPTPTADRDRTVSRRSKPSSRTTLIGEQPNYLKKVIVTSAVDSRLLESLQINIQSTEQNSLSVNISKRLSESSVLIKQSDSIRL